MPATIVPFLNPTRFCVLQILIVSTPAVIYLGHVLLVIQKESKTGKHLQQTNWNVLKKWSKNLEWSGKVKLKGVLLASYMLHLMIKILLEVSFVAGQYYRFGFLYIPVKISCLAYPCQTSVDCFISRPSEKSIIVVFMLAMAVFSVVFNAVEILYLMLSKLKDREEWLSLKEINHRKRLTTWRCLNIEKTKKQNNIETLQINPYIHFIFNVFLLFCFTIQLKKMVSSYAAWHKAMIKNRAFLK